MFQKVKIVFLFPAKIYLYTYLYSSCSVDLQLITRKPKNNGWKKSAV